MFKSLCITQFLDLEPTIFCKICIVELLQIFTQLMQKNGYNVNGNRASGGTSVHHINPTSFSSTTVVMLVLLSTPSNPGQIILLCENPKFRCLSFCKYSGIYTAHKLIEVLMGQEIKLIHDVWAVCTPSPRITRFPITCILIYLSTSGGILH